MAAEDFLFSIIAYDRFEQTPGKPMRNQSRSNHPSVADKRRLMSKVKRLLRFEGTPPPG